MSKKLDNDFRPFVFWFLSPKPVKKGVKIYSPEHEFFFCFGWSVSDLWPIESFLTLDGWWIKHVFRPWRVDDRGSMSLMICRGHIRASKGTFQIFLWLTVLWQIDILVQFCTLVFISSWIWKGCKLVRRSKILSGLNVSMVSWDPVQKQENFLTEAHRSEKDVLFGSKT